MAKKPPRSRSGGSSRNKSSGSNGSSTASGSSSSRKRKREEFPDYEILDPEGHIVPTKVPPVALETGVSLTQPIAIVPKPPNKKGAAIAWTAGGLVAVALAISAANDDDDDDDDDGMTASSP